MNEKSRVCKQDALTDLSNKLYLKFLRAVPWNSLPALGFLPAALAFGALTLLWASSERYLFSA